MYWERKLAVASFVLALGALGMASAAWFETIRSTEHLQEQLAVVHAREQAEFEAAPAPAAIPPAREPSAVANPNPTPVDVVVESPPAVPRGPTEADLLALGEQLARLRSGQPIAQPLLRGPSKGPLAVKPPVLPELQDAPPIESEPDKWALAAARRRVGITMYATQWCGVCRKARAYMKKSGIAFTERDVDASQSASRRHREINPRGSVPTFDIDGNVMVGFSQDRFEGMLNRAARSKL